MTNLGAYLLLALLSGAFLIAIGGGYWQAWDYLRPVDSFFGPRRTFGDRLAGVFLALTSTAGLVALVLALGLIL